MYNIGNTLININKKKNLFFKKKYNNKILISKRLTVVCRKKSLPVKYKKIRFRKDVGNFFFKKFFFKTLLKGRKFLKTFFFYNAKLRQKKLTKTIYLNTKKIFSTNESYENTLLNVLLRIHFFFFYSDVFFFLKKGFVFVNSIKLVNPNILLEGGDCIQLPVTKLYLLYLKFCKKFFKKKISLFKYNSWKFFKNKIIKRKKKIKFKKRKSPKFVQAFFLFKFNVPKFLEIDYFSSTIFFFTKLSTFLNNSYYLNKLFSFKMFNLYNFKKIN